MVESGAEPGHRRLGVAPERSAPREEGARGQRVGGRDGGREAGGSAPPPGVGAERALDLTRLRYDQKKFEEAKALAEEALSITERCGYVLQGADVNLFLAQYVLEQEKDKVKAREYAETALKLATCDGPPYYYKVAYEEAERMLAGF